MTSNQISTGSGRSFNISDLLTYTAVMVSTPKKDSNVTVSSVSGSSSSSSITSKESQAQAYHSPRKARFAEATAVHSPAGLGPAVRTLDMIPPAAFNSYHPQTRPADVGFGYMPEFERNAGVEMPITPFSSIKNRFAHNTPGAHSRMTFGGESVLSPTFREEKALEKREKDTEKQQAKDLVSKHLLATLHTHYPKVPAQH